MATKTVPAYQLQTNISYFTYYAYATGLSGLATRSDAQKVYAKDYNDEWARIAVTPGYTNLRPTNSTGANYPTQHGLTEWYVQVPLMSTNRLLITAVSWWARGFAGGTAIPSGDLVCTLYDRPAGTALASKTVTKASYGSSFQGGAGVNFWVDFVLDKPFVWGEYASGALNFPTLTIGIKSTQGPTAIVQDFASGGVSALGPGYWYATGNSYQQVTATHTPLVQLKTAAVQQVALPVTDSQGRTALAISVADPGLIGPTRDLDLVVDAGGMLDGNGVVAGGIGNTIQYPRHIMRLLDYAWNGSAWVSAGNFDATVFSADNTACETSGGSLERKFFGATDGFATTSDILSNLTRECACYVVPRTNGKLALWPWGLAQTTKRVLWDEDIRVTGWRGLDTTAVINTASVAYAPTLLDVDPNWAVSGLEYGNFKKILKHTARGSGISDISLALYGLREVEVAELGFIDEDAGARVFLQHLLARNDHPPRFVSIEVLNWWDNKDLELLDVIEVISTRLPSFFGTAQNARKATYQGTEVDLNKGGFWKRASRYRLQIVGRTVSWQDGNAPILQLECRTLNPYHPYDPT